MNSLKYPHPVLYYIYFSYYTSRGKKQPIMQSMFDRHKEMASKKGRWRSLSSQNNPSLNRLHNGKKTKKNRKNKHKKKGHNSKRTKDRFPPKARLGSKEEKGLE